MRHSLYRHIQSPCVRSVVQRRGSDSKVMVLGTVRVLWTGWTGEPELPDLSSGASVGSASSDVPLKPSYHIPASCRRLGVAKPIFFYRLPETLSKANSFVHIWASDALDHLSGPLHPRLTSSRWRRLRSESTYQIIWDVRLPGRGVKWTAVQLRRGPPLITRRPEPGGTQRGEGLPVGQTVPR